MLPTFPVSLTREGWEREAPEPSYRWDVGDGKSASKHGASRQQNGIIQIHGLEIKNKDYRDETERYLLLPPSSDWGFWAQLEWMVRETIPVCSLHTAPTAAAAGGRDLG